jgi:hypothetical protein
MQAQVPDRYWETADAERVLQLVEATSPSTQLEIDPPAILWLDNAVARLAELDRENDARLREKGMLVEESDLFRPI